MTVTSRCRGRFLLCVIFSLLLWFDQYRYRDLASPRTRGSDEKETIATVPSGERTLGNREFRKCWDNAHNVADEGGDTGTTADIVRHPPCKPLTTLDEIPRLADLPCNYAHDGFYLQDSNAVLGEVYAALTDMLNKETDPSRIVPVFAEIGGHDGITKSLSLKASRCLHVNTLLIEASPLNYKTLRKSRAYDTTVNAALCDGGFVDILDHSENSGQSRVVAEGQGATATARVPCTTVDDEIEAMRRTLPGDGEEYEMKLVFLVLDVEGHEETAIRGIQKYVPSKAMIEIKHGNKGPIGEWASKNGLVPRQGRQDLLLNFGPDGEYPPNLFYGARKTIPTNIFKTSKVAPAYMHYGE